MSQDNSWQGRVAIITGGSSGIGEATARELTERGANVVITGRDEAKLARVAARSSAIESVQADSADPTGCRRVVEAALGGRDRVGWAFIFAAAAYNLVRLPKLLAVPT